ncbi:MAG TPA: TlpA disulfide reductase family protein [Bacteroidia bacterium]|jgi:thiol-disulfide isomerase/thioredoxin
MKRLLIAFFILFYFQGLAQKISIIKIGDLEQRITNGSDTTYIINFWATWCAPCVKELPGFDSITKSHSSDKVKVLLISMDFKEDLETKVIPFCIKKKLRSEVYLLDEVNGNYFIPKISEKWTGAIPGTLILNNQKAYREFYEKKLSYGFLRAEIEKITLIKDQKK